MKIGDWIMQYISNIEINKFELEFYSFIIGWMMAILFDCIIRWIMMRWVRYIHDCRLRSGVK